MQKKNLVKKEIGFQVFSIFYSPCLVQILSRNQYALPLQFSDAPVYCLYVYHQSRGCGQQYCLQPPTWWISSLPHAIFACSDRIVRQRRNGTQVNISSKFHRMKRAAPPAEIGLDVFYKEGCSIHLGNTSRVRPLRWNAHWSFYQEYSHQMEGYPRPTPGPETEKKGVICEVS